MMKLTRPFARAMLTTSLTGMLVVASLPGQADQAAGPQASPPQATGPAATTPAFVCPYAATDEQIRRMQELHQAMLKAKTPQERARLHEQRWQLMHEGMGTMRRMSPMAGATGSGTGSRPAQGPAPGMGMGMGPGMMQGACMGERMAMMEMMMQMMMDEMETTPRK